MEEKDFITFFKKLEAWHKHQIDQFKIILDHSDAALVIPGCAKIDPDSDIARGIRIGVGLAVEFMGELPVTAEFSCPNCGGTMLGDGYTEVIHCESVDVPLDVEPDADPIYCEYEEEEETKVNGSK